MHLTKRLVGLAFAATLASAACGGGRNSANPSPSGSAQATFTATAVQTATPAKTVASEALAPTATFTAAPVSATATSPAAPSSAPAATAPPPSVTAPPAPAAASVTVTAENLAFDRAVIRVKAGAAVTATLINKDIGVDHNLTFSLPGLGHPTCPGPCTTSQTFTPAQAGPFSFFCTLHATMFGDFIVE